MRRLSLLLLALSLNVAECAAEGWQILKPEGLGFSIEFPSPAPPSPDEQSVDLGDGTSATMRTFQIISDGVMYDVTIADYPRGALASQENDEMLDNARNGALNSAPGTLRSETKVEVAGRPARELLIDMMGMVVRCRVFAVEDRLFNVGVITPKGEETSAPVEKYLASFRLTDAPKP